VVAQAYNPNTKEVAIRGILVQGQPGQNVPKTPSQPIKSGCGDMSLSSSYLASVNSRIAIQPSLGINGETHNQCKNG
jgi:hypothetical protein